MKRYFAVADRDSRVVERLGGRYVSVRPFILAEGDDLHEVREAALKVYPKGSVRIWDRLADAWA